MKKSLICLVAIIVTGCGLSYEQKVNLAQAQQEVSQLEGLSVQEQQKTEEVRREVEMLDRLNSQQRLDYVTSELDRETVKTNQTTRSGTLMGCLLGLVRCRD